MLGALVLHGCSSSVQPTHHYALRVLTERQASSPEARASLAVPTLEVLGAYDTDRIVYRASPYRLDYYEYHRWASTPSLLLSEHLRRAYERTGLFEEVTLDRVPSTSAVLEARLLALEEVDVTPSKWLGRVALDLTLRDAGSGAVLFSREFTREEPLQQQRPEALAAAVSVALEQIVGASARALALAADAATAGPREPACATD